jgi:hypothetical protein
MNNFVLDKWTRFLIFYKNNKKNLKRKKYYISKKILNFYIILLVSIYITQTNKKGVLEFNYDCF